jgi:GNAT superfamily N-acetyltransferase
MRVVIAEGALLEGIFDLTYPIWHEGLTRRGYAQWNLGQMRTAWARDRFQRFALVDDGGEVLASLKRYRYDVRVSGRDGWMSGIGAVFTPPDRRGRGYASELIRRVVDQSQHEGALVAGLFSEIGSDFYRRLGFETVPLEEVTVNVTRKDGAPAMLVRTGDDRDLPAIAALHASRTASAPFALRRDASTIQFALTKKRLFAGLSRAGHRQLEFHVAEEGASAVAYVVIHVTPGGWTLEEWGDRDPAGARLGGMLQVLTAREPSLAVPLIRAWWPRSFPVPPQLTLTDRNDPLDMFMLRALADVPLPRSADDVFYWRSDYF